MSVIAPDEKADFVAILHRHQLAETDFMLQETDTTGGLPSSGLCHHHSQVDAQGKGIPNRTRHRMDGRI